MQGNRNLLAFHVPGTLSANLDIRWEAAFDCRLKHISALASNDSDATLAVGGGADGSTAILAAAAIGDSGAAVEFGLADWATTNPTAVLAKGDLLKLTLDFDGSSGTAAQDVTIVLTLLDG